MLCHLGQQPDCRGLPVGGLPGVYGCVLEETRLPVAYLTVLQAFNIISLYQGTAPRSNYFEHTGVNFGIPYYALSVALNVIVTALICSKLIMSQMRI